MDHVMFRVGLLAVIRSQNRNGGVLHVIHNIVCCSLLKSQIVFIFVYLRVRV